MKLAEFDLYQEYSVAKSHENSNGTLCAYLLDDGKMHPAVLITPGGGYGMLAEHEGKDVAERFVRDGFNAFVLKYSLAPCAYPVQLAEAVMAMGFIRQKADEFGVISDKVASLGFSAGGHLASTLATIGCDKAVEGYIGRHVDARPDASVLVYPVINLDSPFAHQNSAERVSGNNDELKRYLSTEKRVSVDTPPTFLAHLSTDETVPVQNTLSYATALANNGVNFELHVFPEGWHGLGLGDNPETSEDKIYFERWSRWQPMVVEFLRTKHGF